MRFGRKKPCNKYCLTGEAVQWASCFGIKLVSDERSAFAEFEYLKFINLKQTFIIRKFTINKSYRICYVVKS